MRAVIAIALGFLVIVFAIPCPALVPAHLWSQRFGGTTSEISYGVAVDGSGNVLVTGYFAGTVDFGGGNLVSAGGADIFVAKYDVSGAHLWSQRFGGTGFDYGYAVAVDGLGDVVVTGIFQGTVDFGGGNLGSAGGNDIFVAKYDASGAHLWSHRFGSTSSDQGNAVAVDGSGNVVVAGYFFGTVNFGGGNLVSAGIYDIFVAKYDAGGAHLWSRRFGGTSDDYGYGVAVDGSGNVVVTGYFAGTVDFGGGNLVSAGGADIFVAKYDVSGAHLWSHHFGGTGFDYGYAVAVDGSGNVVVTGYFVGTANFGGGNLGSAGSWDIFVAKYNASGAHQWSQRFGGTGVDYGDAVALDGSGNVVVTGYFAGTVNFGGGDLMSAGSYDIFVAKYDASGAHLWSQRFGSMSTDYGFGIAMDGVGNVVVTGTFEGAVDFGGGNLVSVGAQDIFLAKYGEETVPVLISRFDATARPGGVDLTWELSSDEALEGFALYRGQGQAPSVVIATGDAQTTHSYMDTSVEAGKTYQYELMIRTLNGDEFRSPVATVTMPRAVITLAQNFPNPFNPQTTIEYTVSSLASVSIDIFDASGALVRRLDQGVREAGSYSAEWDGRDAANRSVGSGVYFYRLAGVKSAETRKMVLVK